MGSLRTHCEYGVSISTFSEGSVRGAGFLQVFRILFVAITETLAGSLGRVGWGRMLRDLHTFPICFLFVGGGTKKRAYRICRD